MKGSSIAIGIQHLHLSKEFFEDFIREAPASNGAKVFGMYVKRINWIENDLVMNPHLAAQFQTGAKQHLHADPFSLPEIHRKLALVPPEGREAVEKLIDLLLEGETILFEEQTG